MYIYVFAKIHICIFYQHLLHHLPIFPPKLWISEISMVELSSFIQYNDTYSPWKPELPVIRNLDLKARIIE